MQNVSTERKKKQDNSSCEEENVLNWSFKKGDFQCPEVALLFETLLSKR